MNIQLPNPDMRAEAITAFNAGVRAMSEGQTNAAVAEWERAYKLDWTVAPAVHNLAVYYETDGNDARAVELYDRLRGLDPFDTRVLVRQAVALRRLGRMDEAVANYERAISIYPFFRFWYQDLAAILETSGDIEGAAIWKERAEQLDTDDVELAYQDGVKHLRVENYPLAAACFEAVLEDCPANLDARIKLAAAYGAQGQHEEAIAQLSEGLELTDTAAALVHYHRARHLLALNRTGEALTDIEFALDHEPTFGRARLLASQIAPQESGTSMSNISAGSFEAHFDAFEDSFDDTSLTNDATQILDDATNPLPDGEDLENIRTTIAGKKPSPTAPWSDHVIHYIQRAAVEGASAGRPARIACILERHRALAPAADRLAEIFYTPELSKLPGGSQPVYIVEPEHTPGTGVRGIIKSGWLGDPSYPEIVTDDWTNAIDGIPIDFVLTDIARAAGKTGFDLLILLATGRVRPDQTATLQAVRSVPCPMYVMLAPAGRAADLGTRLNGIAAGWTEISIV